MLRINVTIDNPNCLRDGYINVDPLVAENDQFGRVKDNPRELNNFDDGECNEIIGTDIIDYYTPTEVKDMLQVWSKKLAHGGIVTLLFIDIYQISKGIMNRSIDMDVANIYLHGTQEQPWRVKKSSHSVESICKHLEACGLKIMMKRLEVGQAVVKAMRE